MDETAPAASSALRSKELPSLPVLESFLFNSSALGEGGLTLFASGFQTVMGMTANGCSTVLPEGPFAFHSRPRTGLRAQDFRNLNWRRQRLLRLLNMGRRRRGRCPQFWNLDQSQPIFLNGVQGFPFHVTGLPRQRFQPSQKLFLGGFGSVGPDGRDFHGGRRRRPQSSKAG